MPAGKEKEKVTRKVKEITDRWQKVNRNAKEKHEIISNLYPCIVDFDESTAVIESVVKNGEDYLKSHSPSGVDLEDSRQQVNNIRVRIIGGFQLL